MNELQADLFEPKERDPIGVSPIQAANVGSVPQRSPLRYPGGKTWLIPHIRVWLRGIKPKPRLLIEPFAGGGTVSLTAVMEGLADRCMMAELDHDVAAFWKTALEYGPELCTMVMRFEPTREAVAALASKPPQNLLQHGFRTLVLNRTRRGGILAPGASLSRAGENGKGVASRWYPETIVNRLWAIAELTEHIEFRETDGMRLLEEFVANRGFGKVTNVSTVVFVDPPYTAGGKRAGNRLYAHNEVDHPRLFELLAESGAEFLMTYDRAPEIVSLCEAFGFHAVRVMMKNTHHDRIPELIITPRPVFMDPGFNTTPP
ncbi:MAG: DNA adenine methylase [Gemmatimonadota bacterium]|nr:DNA adenine methylase [Gemmatimonadota bacterium]